MNIKAEVAIVINAIEVILAAAIKLDPALQDSPFYKEYEKVIGLLKLIGI